MQNSFSHPTSKEKCSLKIARPRANASGLITAPEVEQVWLWLKGLPEQEQERYRPFALPLVPGLAVYGLLHFKESQQRQQHARKQETDAIVPHFAAMRAQAHLRYNCLVRLRQAYQEAIAQTQQDERTFPAEFSYEEGSERWHFRL